MNLLRSGNARSFPKLAQYFIATRIYLSCQPLATAFVELAMRAAETTALAKLGKEEKQGCWQRGPDQPLFVDTRFQ